MTQTSKHTTLGSIKHIHVVGIAGIGMSAIAEYLMHSGFSVSGSDNGENDLTRRLQSMGATIFKGHSAENIAPPDVVVHTSAVKAHENPETIRAKELGIPVIKRYDLLRAILRPKTSIGVAGTHGKTTTTAMLGLIFIAAKRNPTVLVGGQLPNFDNVNLRFGQGPEFIIESDEYDRTFLRLDLEHSIINNVEADHLDIFGDEASVFQAFIDYSNNLPFYGNLLLNIHDNGVRSILPKINHAYQTFGFDSSCDFSAQNLIVGNTGTRFDFVAEGNIQGTITLSVHGKHNVNNALGAAAMAHKFGISFNDIEQGLAEFGGVQRRFQQLFDDGSLRIIDDYAHHPTEVKASILAAQQSRPNHTIVAIFQPHLYSRTADFHQEFAGALNTADTVLLAPLYPAREKPVAGISSHTIAQNLSHFNGIMVCADSFGELEEHIEKHLGKNTTLLFMGAGNITDYAHSTVASLSKEVNS